MKKIMKNNIKIISGIVLMFIILAMLILIFLNIEDITKATEEEVDAETEELETSEPTTVNEETSTGEVGEYAYISSVQITKTVTGVGPFDDESETDSSSDDGSVTWTAGDDTTEDDNIVRSFDQITWTIDNTMKLKETATEANYTGGTINITATVPSDLANLVEWDIDSMTWAKNAEVSNDGTTFTAQYTMTDTSVTIPGQQSLVLVLQIYGAGNGTEIIPTFTVSLEGNDETEIIQTTGETIYVSAAPNYNIKLVRNTYLEKKTTVDYGEGNTSGRMYGYGIILQLYNTDTDKGLKGIEYPTENITFDINVKLERTLDGSSATEDITDVCTPILWNYKINSTSSNYGVISDRIMYWGSGLHRYINSVPYGIILTDRTTSVYNSGNITMSQDRSTISVTISEYDFDGTFPIYNYINSSVAHTSVDYADNIGCFSVGYFQIFVPDNEESTIEDRSYYLTVSDSNFSATSTSGTTTITQQVTSDDSSKVQHVIYKVGYYNQHFLLYNDNRSKRLNTSPQAGDGYATLGQYIQLGSKFSMSVSNEDDVYTANKFIKFDGDCVEPVLYSDGSKYKTSAFSGTMTFNVWYVTKKDGTNWESVDEMNNANIEDMLVFESIEDIPPGYICVGEYFESDDSYGNLSVLSGDNNNVWIRLKVKDTATIGKTYAFTGRTQYWITALDRSVYTITNQGNFEYPTATWDSGNKQYVKTEYDENGEIVSGTHYNGYSWGQSLLIVGGELTVTKTAIDDDENEKINYDYSKSEYNITYKIRPNLSASTTITGATLKITDTLPVGMTYVAGSSDYGEPEITENSDGTTTLTWYLYGISSDEELPTITYQAHLDELLSNGTQLETTTVIAEVPDEDVDGNLTYKIGNTEVTNRTYNYDIQIINLSSYTFYKTTETPVIEVDGTIHYRLTVLNNTDEDVTDFQLLDILPYNGDGRGTDYNGTYTVSTIEITQTNVSTSEEITDNVLNLYITSEESVRDGVTAQDDDLGQTAIWTSSTEGTEVNEELTAYAVIGILKAREKLEIDIYMKTEDNEPYDVYKNSATAQTNKDTEAMETSIITVQDIKRILDGYVWFDINRDGLINDGEEYLEGIKVTLLDSEGNTAYDINGEEISSVYTDAEGYYKFENMVIGDYIVQIDWSSISNYEQTQVTTKEVGVNVEINSKFNSNGKTDIITSLNSIESPVMEENYVNAGITYIPGTITITKVAEERYSKVLSGTEFALYKLECTEHAEGYHDDRLVEEDEDCWTLVSTGTTGDDGTLSFDDLTVIYEYRLVETKASEDRLIASGEWEIEFIYGDEVNNYGTDDTIINVDGTLMRITAVGNPPAMVQTSDGLLVPNKLIYEIPVSGGLGVSDYLKIGLTVTFVGLIVFGSYQIKKKHIKIKFKIK